MKFSKTTLVFIHGAGGDHTTWLYQKRYFESKKYNVLALDLPGHGDKSELKANSDISSIAVKIYNKLKKIKNENIILIGHSMGCLIALDIIAKNLENAVKGIFLGFSYPMFVNKFLLDLSKKNQSQAISKMVDWSLPSACKLNGGNIIGINLPNLIYTVMENTPKGNLYNDLKACNNYRLNESSFKNIRIPITCISGSFDIMTPKINLKNITKINDNFSIKIINGHGHFLPLECPSELNVLLRKEIENC
mgnify:FL=1